MNDPSRIAILLGVAVTAFAVTRIRDPLRQTLALSLYGLVLAVLFVLYHAPDVGLSQIVVGAVVLPMMVLLALTKVAKRERRDREHAGRRHG